MSEQLAIAPPPPERQSPQDNDDGEILSGTIVGAEHPGLDDSFDATPSVEGEAADVVTEDPKVEKPEVFSVVDAGVDENGKRQPYERTYVRGEDGQYQENVDARRKATIVSPDGQGGWTTENPYNNTNSQQNAHSSEQRGSNQGRSFYDDFLENDYVPPQFRDREEPLHGYEKRVWDDVKTAMQNEQGGQDETLSERVKRERAEWTEEYHSRFDKAGEEELKRRETEAEAAGETLRDLIDLSKQEKLGIFDPTRELLGAKLRQEIEESIAQIQEGLRSADPRRRAEATNALLDAVATLHELRHGEVHTAEDKLNRHVFSPSDMRSFLRGMKEEVGKERYSLQRDASQERLTDEEQHIANEIIKYGMNAATAANNQGMLIDGAAVFGPTAEKSFKEGLDGSTDYRLSKLSKEELSTLVGNTFQKLRDRAVLQMENKNGQTLNKPIKEAIVAQQDQSKFGLAA